MATRHKTALEIQEGACNVRAIARALVEAADQAANEGTGQNARHDAAVRLIVHQLSHLCEIDEINNDLSLYGDLRKECETAE